MFKLSEDFEREFEFCPGTRFVSYNMNPEKLEQERQKDIEKLEAMIKNLKEMSIEEYDVYYDTTHVKFEEDLTFATSEGCLDTSTTHCKVRYGDEEPVYYLTTV